MKKTVNILYKIDLLLVVLIFPIALPIMMLAGIFLIVFNGRALFRQERIGFEGKKFTIYKFQTLLEGAQEQLSHNIDENMYVFGGRFLRSSKIDELPQLVNVLKGDMSLVGPRPGLLSDTSLIEIRARYGCFSVRPGVSGLAQILKISMNNKRRLARVDQVFVKNRSVRLYFYILFRTGFIWSR